MKLVATSVVRGSRQGDSHGGVYVIDPESHLVGQPIDWNTVDIDWRGRGWDRGLRGIAFDGDIVYIAASDECIRLVARFRADRLVAQPLPQALSRNRNLGTQTFSDVDRLRQYPGFNLDEKRFDWAMHVQSRADRFRPVTFDPMSDSGPLMLNKLHLNNVHCEQEGMYISGLKSGGMLHFGRQGDLAWP